MDLGVQWDRVDLLEELLRQEGNHYQYNYDMIIKMQYFVN